LFSELTTFNWFLLVLAALGIGISKAGLSGISMVHVMVFAHIFGAFDSTGKVLPLLIVGDICAAIAFGGHANWSYVARMLPPSLVGVITGWQVMQAISSHYFEPIIGSIILALTVFQLIRLVRAKEVIEVPNNFLFSTFMGFLVGFTTMMANAAGPVFALYLISLAVPKLEFVGTGAWFFLILNVSKVPLSFQMGLIDQNSLLLNLLLAPIVPVGMLIGKRFIDRLPQTTFNIVILGITAMAAIRLIIKGLFV
jgi:uncharacterized protein